MDKQYRISFKINNEITERINLEILLNPYTSDKTLVGIKALNYFIDLQEGKLPDYLLIVEAILSIARAKNIHDQNIDELEKMYSKFRENLDVT